MLRLALLDLIVMKELTLHSFLEKAAWPPGVHVYHLYFLPHFSTGSISLPCLAVLLPSSGQPFGLATNYSPLIMPAPERVRAIRPTTWLSPLSVTPEERPALLHETEGSCRSSQNPTPVQIADAPVSFAVNKRPLVKPLLTRIRMSDSQMR